MKNIRAPRFLNDLYRDLRDRRLLLPAVALLLALIAVPAALSSSSSSTSVAPAPAAGESAGRATAAQSAVLAETRGVTNYRKRLEQFKSKNPFQQHFTSVPESAKLETSSGGSLQTSSGAATSGSSVDAGSALPTTDSGVSSTTPAPAPTTSGSTGSTGGSSSNHHHSSPPKTITQLVQRRIDVKVGPQGDLVKKTGVKQLSFLPDAGSPLVAFLGTNENGKKAFFLVSSDVTSATGDGVCLTTTPTCQYLTLTEGEVETLDYSLDPGTPYKLKLLNIHDVVVKKH